MEELVLETVKIDKISHKKRLLCYYYFYLQMQNKSISEMWSNYKNLLDDKENWTKYYKNFFENASIDDEKECVEICYIVTGNKDTSLQNKLIKLWRQIKDVIKKEIDCEKRLRDILNNKANDHPIVTKIIIVILSGILLGLVEDCIHDAIQMNTGQSEAQITNIYITDENSNYMEISYKGNSIVVESKEK